MNRRVKKITVAAAILLVMAGAAVWRLSRTPEWTILFGDIDARIRICRTARLKSRTRSMRMLVRLLNDDNERVRYETLSELIQDSELARLMQAEIEDRVGDGNADIRGQALAQLLVQDEKNRARWLQNAVRELEESPLRKKHYKLLGLVIQIRAENGDDEVAGWAMKTLKSDSAATEALMPLCRFPELLLPHKRELFAALDRMPRNVYPFLVAALTALDQFEATKKAEAQKRKTIIVPLERFSVEAEWAYNLMHNYQIEEYEGVVALTLHEGGGGMHRNGGGIDSLNIGKGEFPFTIGRAGRYRVWAHVWFMDKCANTVRINVDRREIGIFARGKKSSIKYGQWQWRRVDDPIYLRAGRHILAIQALEDGVHLDKFVVLLEKEKFDPNAVPPLAPLFNDGVRSSLSFSTEKHAQQPGSSQTITVWVRRNSEALGEAMVELVVPEPFKITDGAKQAVEFSDGCPLGSAVFTLLVPEGTVGGERKLTAMLLAKGKTIVSKEFILGVPFKWYTTGPMAPSDPKCRKLLRNRRASTNDFPELWKPYPEKGYDRYRRFDFEDAFGPSRDKYVFLHTKIEVAEKGNYLHLFTVDDHGYVFIDGRYAIGRGFDGYAELDMMMRKQRLKAGTHDVLLRIYQGKVADPLAGDLRATQNYWVCMWVLRKELHEPAEGIRGVMPSDQ